MASIIAYTETRDTAITAASRFAVAEARRVADDLGATVYAILALGPTNTDQLATLAGEVGTAGADRILCCSDEALAGPPLDATHGALLATVAERLRPIMVLFPEGETGPKLGPALADRMNAAFLGNSALAIQVAIDLEPAQLLVRCQQGNPLGLRLVNLREFERPVIVTLLDGPAPPALGEPASEMEMLSYPV
jgi:electron transfer flavoprotein alpha subunit